ncbi:MAG TPA: cobalamin-dependent protein [Planctomycetaceae bacterium]|jgi:LAO/AO transport system ATPase
MDNSTPERIVLAKIGLDGHDRGVKVVARGLRDAGFHVIYAGIWQSPEAVVRAVLDEDADWLGLSLLSGAHRTLVPRVLGLLQSAGLGDVRVLVGGIIPEQDVAELKQFGVAEVFGPGTTIEAIGQFLHARHTRSADRHKAGAPEGDRHRLSRLISAAARGESPDAGRDLPGARARVIAVTGGGGVGKSTLIGQLIEIIREAGRSVAVLACDPRSPITGGALLGDRIRMPSRPDDDDLFIRSLATPSGHSGVAPHLDQMIDLFGRFGYGTVIVETVGAGQGDTAIRQVADVVVVLVQPETGDELQWEKAGQLEIADIVVVHKADLPRAESVESQVRELLNLPGCRPVPVVRVSSSKGIGVPELWAAIQERLGS